MIRSKKQFLLESHFEHFLYRNDLISVDDVEDFHFDWIRDRRLDTLFSLKSRFSQDCVKGQNDREVIKNWNGTGRTGTVLDGYVDQLV